MSTGFEMLKAAARGPLPSGAPPNKINDLDGRLAALAAVVSGSFGNHIERNASARSASFTAAQ
jgi:hypothetical protein